MTIKENNATPFEEAFLRFLQTIAAYLAKEHEKASLDTVALNDFNTAHQTLKNKIDADQKIRARLNLSEEVNPSNKQLAYRLIVMILVQFPFLITSKLITTEKLNELANQFESSMKQENFKKPTKKR